MTALATRKDQRKKILLNTNQDVSPSRASSAVGKKGVERRALSFLGPGVIVDSLELRRTHQRSLSAVQADVWTSLAMSAAPTSTSHNILITEQQAQVSSTHNLQFWPNSSSPIKQHHPPLFPTCIDQNLELSPTLHSTRTAPSSPSPEL